MPAVRTITPTLARRLAITRQHLAGPPIEADPKGIYHLVRDLGCLQLDPISVVARSHLLVLWSRLGSYDPVHLDTLLWQERRLFEYWAHAASIVLTEDYPLYEPRMRAFATDSSGRGERRRAWLERNRALYEAILATITARGPLPSRYFEDGTRREDWYAGAWTPGRTVSEIIGYLWSSGQLMVAGRVGGQKLWDLADRCLPAWTPRHRLSEEEVVERAAQRSLRALGVAPAAHISRHFIRGRYPGLKEALAELETSGRVVRLRIAEDGRIWPGLWYVHADDLPLLERLAAGDWQPRTTLLSPFDNLICDRTRTETLFGFHYRTEIYVPRAQRRYGYYALPILHGDRLIGRIDPSYDRRQRRLNIHAVHVEPNAPSPAVAGPAVRAAIEGLAAFLGAKDIACGEGVPEVWARTLR